MASYGKSLIAAYLYVSIKLLERPNFLQLQFRISCSARLSSQRHIPQRFAKASQICSTCSGVWPALMLQRSRAPPSGVAGGNTRFT